MAHASLCPPEQYICSFEGSTDLKTWSRTDSLPTATTPAAALMAPATALMEELNSLLDSPPSVHAALTQPVAIPPSGSGLLEELFESPFPMVASSLECGAEHDEVERSQMQCGGCNVSKKLCLDGAAAGVAPQLAEKCPLELICLILSFLFADDIGNHNSGTGAVSSMWRRATEWLVQAWAKDPHAIPMIASPCVAMRAAASRMRIAVDGRWSCTYPCAGTLSRCHIERLLSPDGWLVDDTIVLFFGYVLGVPSLSDTIVAAKAFLSSGQLDEWVCPQAFLIEPHLITAFGEVAHMDDAADLFHKNPMFGDVLGLIMASACTVYVPVCVHRSHWILVVVWLCMGVVEVYDSMGGTHNDAAQLVISFLNTMCRKHVHITLNNLLDIHGWAINPHGVTSPQQDDFSACGVFVCITGICITLDRPVAFSHREVGHWRLRIAFLLVTNPAAVVVAATPTCSPVVRVREDLDDGSLEILSDSE